MSEMERLEARLRALGAAPEAGADWDDVLRRAGRAFPRQIPRRRLAFALAAAIVVVASVVGVLVTRGTQSGSKGANGDYCLVPSWCGPTGPLGPTGSTSYGPTGPIFGPTGYIGPTGLGGPSGWIDYTGPGFLTPSEIDEWFSKRLATSIYWAGPIDGTRYEVWNRHRYFLIRYVPEARQAREGAPYLSVATYPFPGAFDALKEQARGGQLTGPGGSIIYVSSRDPKRVYMAFPNVDYEIEVYDPSPAAALATAQSGKIRPVR